MRSVNVPSPLLTYKWSGPKKSFATYKIRVPVRIAVPPGGGEAVIVVLPDS